MREALRLLHDDCAEYARINHLGGFNNHAMLLARAALALPCSCVISFDGFAQLLVKHSIIDELAIYDSAGYDGGKMLDRLRLVYKQLQKEGDASCAVTTPMSNMVPSTSTGADQSNPEPAPTPRTDAAWNQYEHRGISPTSWEMRDLARQLERDLDSANAAIRALSQTLEADKKWRVELTRDKERLDWVDHNWFKFKSVIERHTTGPDDIRQAIDKARRNEG